MTYLVWKFLHSDTLAHLSQLLPVEVASLFIGAGATHTQPVPDALQVLPLIADVIHGEGEVSSGRRTTGESSRCHRRREEHGARYGGRGGNLE